MPVPTDTSNKLEMSYNFFAHIRTLLYQDRRVTLRTRLTAQEYYTAYKGVLAYYRNLKTITEKMDAQGYHGKQIDTLGFEQNTVEVIDRNYAKLKSMSVIIYVYGNILTKYFAKNEKATFTEMIEYVIACTESGDKYNRDYNTFNCTLRDTFQSKPFTIV